MITFNELIEKGVAEPNYKTTTQPDHFEWDEVVVRYNQIWGCVTDTHCAKLDRTRYIITGQLIKNPIKTEQLVFDCSWGGYKFGCSICHAENLCQFAADRHLNITHEIVNGDDVLILSKYTKEQEDHLTKYKLSDAKEELFPCFKY